MFLFLGNVGGGILFVVSGVNFGVTFSIVQVFSINCWGQGSDSWLTFCLVVGVKFDDVQVLFLCL